MRHWFILITILLAFFLWYITFVLRPFNFWLMMSGTTIVLSLFAIILDNSLFHKEEWNVINIGIGLLSAGVLYVIFIFGHQLLSLIGNVVSLFNRRAEDLQMIYANRGEMAAHWNALLLFFPIGFGEEIYWRGLVQKHFTRRISRVPAYLLTTMIYTAVHLPSGNVVLILAALTCGLFWGGLYLICGSLVPVLISHMIWDPLIFVIFPIM